MHAFHELISRFRAPESSRFGETMAPVMYEVSCRAGAWQEGRLTPYGPIPLDPAVRGLHYAHTLYEGMKAFRWAGGRVCLFRPLDHHARMVTSAARLCMPEIPRDLFMEALESLVRCCAPIVPDGGGSLYLRPLLFATDAKLGLDVSETFRFMVIASPSGAYYARPITLLVEREETRAAGSLGAAKVSANYAASTLATQRARRAGFDQPVWLDPHTRRNVEELSGMNLFAVIDGALWTPSLSGTFLAGITRDSVLALARADNLAVVEDVMPVEHLLSAVADGRCTEMFATGTGAGVCPVSGIADAHRPCLPLAVAPGPVTERLARHFEEIQQGRRVDAFGWMVEVTN